MTVFIGFLLSLFVSLGYSAAEGYERGNKDFGSIDHIGTKAKWSKGSSKNFGYFDGQFKYKNDGGLGDGLVIPVPSGVQAGDMMIAFLMRTDDYLCVGVPGWQIVASVHKYGNEVDGATWMDCKDWKDEPYACRNFKDGNGNVRDGRDLAQAVFVRRASSNEPDEYKFDLRGGNAAGWGFITVLRGAKSVRAWTFTSEDKYRGAKFPSLSGASSGDLLLLSNAFDDDEPSSKFPTPSGTTKLGFIAYDDETGMLFGKRITSSGSTGEFKTGCDNCLAQGQTHKDAIISLLIKPGSMPSSNWRGDFQDPRNGGSPSTPSSGYCGYSGSQKAYVYPCSDSCGSDNKCKIKLNGSTRKCDKCSGNAQRRQQRPPSDSDSDDADVNNGRPDGRPDGRPLPGRGGSGGRPAPRRTDANDSTDGGVPGYAIGLIVLASIIVVLMVALLAVSIRR